MSYFAGLNIEYVPSIRFYGFHNSGDRDYYSFDNLFANCHNLEAINVINLGSCSSAVGMFSGCERLKHIAGFDYLRCDLDLGDSPLLLEESLNNIISHADTVPLSDGRYINIHPRVYDRITDDTIFERALDKGWVIKVNGVIPGNRGGGTLNPNNIVGDLIINCVGESGSSTNVSLGHNSQLGRDDSNYGDKYRYNIFAYPHNLDSEVRDIFTSFDAISNSTITFSYYPNTTPGSSHEITLRADSDSVTGSGTYRYYVESLGDYTDTNDSMWLSDYSVAHVRLADSSPSPVKDFYLRVVVSHININALPEPK